MDKRYRKYSLSNFFADSYYFRLSLTFVEDIDFRARIACAHSGVILAPTVDIRLILRHWHFVRRSLVDFKPAIESLRKVNSVLSSPLLTSLTRVSFLTFAVPRYYCGELSDPRPTSLSPYCVCSADYCDAYLTHDSVRRQKLMQLRSEWKFLSTLNSPQFESSMMQVTSTK